MKSNLCQLEGDTQVIHETAIIDPSAKLAADVRVGPYSVIGPDVFIDEGTEIGPHAVIKGPSRIGKHNKIFQFASIGEDCQDKKFIGEHATLEVGDGNVFREFCTIHRGTAHGGSVTRIGNDNLFMAYTHVAHDCIVGNEVVMSNNATLAGHVVVGDAAIMSGFTAIHQFCYVGAHSFIGGGAKVVKDILPFVMISCDAHCAGLNLVGLKRRGYDADSIAILKKAYRIIFRSGNTVAQSIEELEQLVPECEAVQAFIDGLQASERGIVR